MPAAVPLACSGSAFGRSVLELCLSFALISLLTVCPASRERQAKTFRSRNDEHVLRSDTEATAHAVVAYPLRAGGTVNARTVIQLAAVGILSVLLLSSCMPTVFQTHLSQALLSPPISSLSPAPQYYSPLQNAEYVSKGATIVVRYGPVLSDGNLQGLTFNVQGSRSGDHSGHIILADDHKTVVFKPDLAFTPGEMVIVNVSSLQLDQQTTYPALCYAFTVAVNQQQGSPGSSQLSNPPIPAKPPRSAFPDFLTVPQDIPHFVVSATSPDDGEGDIFVAPFYWTEFNCWVLSPNSKSSGPVGLLSVRF